MCVCVSAETHINVQILSEWPGCNDGLSDARAYFVGSPVRQLRSHGDEDPWPIDPPVAIDDGHTTFGFDGFCENIIYLLMN